MKTTLNKAIDVAFRRSFVELHAGAPRCCVVVSFDATGLEIQVWWRSTLTSQLDERLAKTSPEIAEHIRAALRILADERDVVHVFVQSDEGFLLETYAPEPPAPRDVADKGVS